MKKYMAYFMICFSIVMGMSTVDSFAGRLCDAVKQSAGEISGGRGNPYRDAQAGATLGALAASIIYCALGW